MREQMTHQMISTKAQGSTKIKFGIDNLTYLHFGCKVLHWPWFLHHANDSWRCSNN